MDYLLLTSRGRSSIQQYSKRCVINWYMISNWIIFNFCAVFRCLRSNWDNYMSSCMLLRTYGSLLKTMSHQFLNHNYHSPLISRNFTLASTGPPFVYLPSRPDRTKGRIDMVSLTASATTRLVHFTLLPLMTWTSSQLLCALMTSFRITHCEFMKTIHNSRRQRHATPRFI